MPSPTPPAQAEPASFRDAASRVFYRDDVVLRGLNEQAAADYEALGASEFFPRLMDEGKIVRTSVATLSKGVEPDGPPWRLVLEHERIPFVSYPYEWSFSMLRDAAVLHLELLLEALGEGMTLKDGYAFNIQWRGAQPVFIDVGSFERNPHGGPWAGYRQFCQTFLYPLLLHAHKGVPFQGWLRGSVEGVHGAHLRRLMSRRDLLRAGVLKHVVLHSAMESRFTSKAQSVQSELRSAGFTSELTQALVKNLLKLVRKLKAPTDASHWADYRRTCTYTDHDRTEKEAFVLAAAEVSSPRLVWDLGCNDGHYARVVADDAELVVAVDGDEAVIDGLYRSLHDEGNTNILPLVVDLTDPSPGLGWRGQERRSFTDRGAPDLVLCLALVHHLVIGANIPLAEVMAWLGSLGGRLVVEFAGRDDAMVQQLLANKPPRQHDDYHQEEFERLLHERFTVERTQALPSDSRTLYLATPRS